jgi:TRAP-type C4-dicarboxylate transport system permease small subunit
MVCLVLSDLLMLVCCGVFFWGTWQQASINLTNTAPISGISMLWVYGVGFFTSTAIGAMIVAKLVRAMMGRLTDAELVEVVENEGLKEAQALANSAAMKR